MVRTVYALILLLIVAPATASAQIQQVDTTRTRESLRVAQQLFDQTPACGTPKIYLADPSDMKGSGRQDALGVAEPSICVILLNRRMYQGTGTYETRIHVCNVIAHEYGHVLGFMHGPPTSVMREEYDLRSVVYGCYKRFLPRGKAREWRANHGRSMWLSR